jgi:hypothetical protein
MKLKFLRNVAVYSEHREKGSVHEIKDSDAIFLIADRCAVKVAAQQATPIETARSPKAAAAETATLKTRK